VQRGLAVSVAASAGTHTYASWLNQVERFFALITQRATRRANSQPFVWTATADSILQKLARLCQRIFGTEH
jgi:putative transposase